MTIEANRQDILSIQMLRGIAALMVVFVHVDVQLIRLGYDSIHSAWLASGVDIFFVISGFIMWVSADQRPTMTAATFMKNRIIRIVPLYWTLTAGLVVMALLTPNLLHTTVFEPSHALKSFLFLPSRHPTTGDFWPVLVPGWTLNFEMFFYALFAVAIAAGRGSAARRLAWISGLILTASAVANLLALKFDTMRFYADLVVLEFLAGIFVGIAFRRRMLPVSWFWLAAVATGFFCLWLFPRSGVPHPLAAGIPATVIVMGALFTPAFRFAPLQALGDASYSLYLSHVVTLAAIGFAWGQLGLTAIGPTAFIALCVAGCLFVAHVLYRAVERPLTLGLKDRLHTPRVEAAA